MQTLRSRFRYLTGPSPGSTFNPLPESVRFACFLNTGDPAHPVSTHDYSDSDPSRLSLELRGLGAALKFQAPSFGKLGLILWAFFS